MNLQKRKNDAAADSNRAYVPFTRKELAESRNHRKFITALSELSARLWMCVHFAENACDAVDEGNYSRAYGYFKYLDVGDEYDQSSLTVAIGKVRAQIIAAGEGNAPVAGSVRAIHRVLATYIQLRREIHGTASIFDADCAGRSLEAVLLEHQIVCGVSEKYERHVNAIFEKLLNGLADHYTKTCAYLCAKAEQRRDDWPPRPASAADVRTTSDAAADKIVMAIETGSAQVANAVRKKPGKRRKYPDELVRDVCAIWEEAQRRPKVKSSTNKRTCYEAGFTYARSRLRALGVNTLAEFKSIIGANSDRRSRLNRRR